MKTTLLCFGDREGLTHSPVESSSIASAAYGPAEEVLELRFRGGAVYRYANVPAGVHSAFMAAESKGRYFNQAIRGRFEYRRSRA